jgi:hypothetical protein
LTRRLDIAGRDITRYLIKVSLPPRLINKMYSGECIVPLIK